MTAIDTALDSPSPYRRGRTVGGRLGLATLLGVVCAASFVLGTITRHGQSAQYNRSKGACIALEFAENFGAVGTTQKRQALRAMTSSAVQDQGFFPKSVEEFEDFCISTWTSESRFGR